MRLIQALPLGGLALLTSCLTSFDENAWKNRDGRPGSDASTVDLHVDSPRDDGPRLDQRPDGPLPDQELPDGPPPVTECNDGTDNDGDGATDYPADPGCSGPMDTSELGSAACDNGQDDDGDGTIDYGATGGDPGCSGPSDTSEKGSTACDDGQDNDSDGKTDFRTDGTGDPDCSGPTDTSESADPCGDWSSWSCSVKANNAVGRCPATGTQVLSLVCNTNKCACSNIVTLASNNCVPTGITCSEVQASFTQGCCDGL